MSCLTFVLILPSPSPPSIDDFKFEDFELENYKPHGKIAMAMAV